jgi:hypothetical protein
MNRTVDDKSGATTKMSWADFRDIPLADLDPDLVRAFVQRYAGPVEERPVTDTHQGPGQVSSFGSVI